MNVMVKRRPRLDVINRRLRDWSISAEERVALVCEKMELGGY